MTEKCATCHPGVKDVEDIRFATDTTDWNGNGDVKEGVYKEVDGLRVALYAEIQKYATAKGTSIVYDPGTNPYFFVDKNKDGKADLDDKGAAIRYNAWTVKLVKAAYNYQFSIKEPGGFAHNPKYVMQVLYDSIKDLGGDVSKFTRPEAK